MFRNRDETFHLTEKGTRVLSGGRWGAKTRHSSLSALRQNVHGHLAGNSDVNDVERLRIELAMHCLVADHSPREVHYDGSRGGSGARYVMFLVAEVAGPGVGYFG